MTTTYKLSVKTEKLIGEVSSGINVEIKLRYPETETSRFSDAGKDSMLINEGLVGVTDENGEIIFNLTPSAQFVQGSLYLAVLSRNSQILGTYSFEMPSNSTSLHQEVDQYRRTHPTNNVIVGQGAQGAWYILQFRRSSTTPTRAATGHVSLPANILTPDPGWRAIPPIGTDKLWAELAFIDPENHSGDYVPNWSEPFEWTGSIVTVTVDNSTIEFNSAGALEVRDEGITSIQIAAAAITKDKIAASNVSAEKLEADQRLPKAEEGKFLKWENGILINTDAPQGGGNVAPFTGVHTKGALTGTGLTGDELDVASGGIDTDKLADHSVDRDKLAAGTLYSDAEIKTKYESNDNTNAFTDANKSKLASIEDDATADQTASEIKTLYESNDNTNAFTDANKTKLASIEAGAQKNPKHTIAFRAIDANPDNIQAGEIGFIKADNTQWQNGSSDQIVAISIPATMFALNQNPSLDNPVGVDMSYLEDKAANGSSSIYVFQKLNDDSSAIDPGHSFTVQVETTIKNDDGSYALQNLNNLITYDTTGTGFNWQVAGGDTVPVGNDAVIGRLPKTNMPTDVVYTEQLQGSELDRYFSYNSGSENYWPGRISLYNQASGAPDFDNIIGQPDIADGTVTVAVGTPRTDRDPSNYVAGTDYVATDFVSGDIYYLSDWNNPNKSGTLTLTSGGTVEGTGNARKVYFTATLVLTGTDLSDPRDHGDYWRFGKVEPTKLKIQIPTSDLIGDIYADDIDLSGANAIGDPVNSDLKLAVINGTLVAYISILHLERHFADRYSPYVGYTAVNSSQYDAKGELDVGQLNNANPIVRFAPKDADLQDLESDITNDTIFELYHDSSNYYLLKATEINGKVVRNDSFKTSINGRYVNTSRVEKVGTISANDSFEIRVYKKGDGLVPVPSNDDIGKRLEAVGINRYEWREDTGETFATKTQVEEGASTDTVVAPKTLADRLYPLIEEHKKSYTISPESVTTGTDNINNLNGVSVPDNSDTTPPTGTNVILRLKEWTSAPSVPDGKTFRAGLEYLEGSIRKMYVITTDGTAYPFKWDGSNYVLSSDPVIYSWEFATTDWEYLRENPNRIIRVANGNYVAYWVTFENQSYKFHAQIYEYDNLKTSDISTGVPADPNNASDTKVASEKSVSTEVKGIKASISDNEWRYYEVSADTTIPNTANRRLYIYDSSHNITVTLSTPNSGQRKEFRFKNGGTGILTLETSGSETLDGFVSVQVSPAAPYIWIYWDGDEWFILERRRDVWAIADVSGLASALSGKDPKPLQSNPNITGTESGNSWTDVHTNCNDNDRFVLAMVYSDGSNYGYAHADFRFADMANNSSRKHWFPLPANSGARVQLNRNGTTLRAQKAGPITDINLRILYYANYYD